MNILWVCLGKGKDGKRQQGKRPQYSTYEDHIENIGEKATVYKKTTLGDSARTYLELPLQQWGAGNVYILVLSSWKVKVKTSLR